MKQAVKKLLRAVGQRLIAELHRFLSFIFSEKYCVSTVVILAGIFCSVLSYFFSPWQTENSYFDKQVPLFHIVMSGVEDILTAVEYGLCMPTDKCIVFAAMIMCGVFVSKWQTDKLAEQYAPNRFCRILFEISAENIAFYLSVMLSYILILPVSDIIDTMNEYGILVVILVLLVGLVFILPGSLYSAAMFVSMYAAFEILNNIESVCGKIITVTLALAVNLLIDHLLTQRMFNLMETEIRYLTEKLFAADYPRESLPA